MHLGGHHFSYSVFERRKLQNPEQILQSIGLKGGMCFVDSGCNDGFFTLPAARLVGTHGLVIALDIDAEALNRLKMSLQAEKLHNTQIIHQAAEDVVACHGCADIVFLGTVLHDFEDPLRVLQNSRTMLKSNGMIYDYDWIKQDSPLGPPKAKRFSQEHVEQLAAQAGLKVISSTVMSENFYAMTLTA